jgi:hypothetical protein
VYISLQFREEKEEVFSFPIIVCHQKTFPSILTFSQNDTFLQQQSFSYQKELIVLSKRVMRNGKKRRKFQGKIRTELSF